MSAAGASTRVNGTLTASTGIDLLGGIISGSGKVDGDLFNSSELLPGDTLGSLTVTGDYSQDSTGILDIGIGCFLLCDDYDLLDIWGTADLGGILKVSVFGGFAPSLGDTFDILLASSLNGSTFDLLNFAIFSGKTFDIFYGEDFVRLTTVASAVPVPAAVWLFGSGLLVLVGMARRKKYVI